MSDSNHVSTSRESDSYHPQPFDSPEQTRANSPTNLDHEASSLLPKQSRRTASNNRLQNFLSEPKYLFPFLAVIFLTAAHFRDFLSKRGDVVSGFEISKARTPKGPSLPERVDRILSESPLIDTHIDLPILIRALYKNEIYDSNFTDSFANGGLYGHVDIPRLQDSKLGGVFWSVWTECPPESLDPKEEFKDEVYYESIHDTVQQIDLMKRLVDAYPDSFELATSSSAFERVFKESKGTRVASVLGIEGLHQIGNSPAAIRLFYDVGVRYITLTHNCNNQYADGALVPAPHWNGLNPRLGPPLIKEFNRLGMIVDISHVSAATMIDVLEVTEAPVIFSHSSAYSLTPHPRNVPDDVLLLVKQNGGVVQINFNPEFITQAKSKDDGDEFPATIQDVVEHVAYIGEKIGWDYVGFGSDFDGIPGTPTGLDDIADYPNLVAKLLKRGVSDENVKKVTGANLLRVWKEVEAVSKRLKKEKTPILEDVVKKMHFSAADVLRPKPQKRRAGV